jgi:hypothetical protein
MSERLKEGYEYCKRLGPDAAARTLLAYLTWRYPHSSRTEWAARIASDHGYL